MKSKILLLALILGSYAFTATGINKPFGKDNDIFGMRGFIENKGQFDDHVNTQDKVYFAFTYGYENIYFTNHGLIHAIVKDIKVSEKVKEAQERGEKLNVKTRETYFVKSTWQNSNQNVQIVPELKQSHYITYGDPQKNSAIFKKITYKNIYNNIDVEYTIPEDHEYGIKYSIILHPGANPADVQILYSGDVKSIKTNNDGDVVITTPHEPVIEHAPKSFYSDNSESLVASSFTVKNNLIGIKFPQNYDNSKTLIFDPWLTNLTTLLNTNYGFDVDYDINGNLFVYGGTFNFKIAKYNNAGVLQWTFPGSIAVPAWNTTTMAGNFVCHRPSGKIYTCSGFNGSPTRAIRLDALGAYNALITPSINTFLEGWEMNYSCETDQIYYFGGSTASKQCAAIINQTSGNIAPIAPMNQGTFAHDIATSAIDANGESYVIWASIFGAPAINGWIGKINSAFTATVWAASCTYNGNWQEVGNKSQYTGAGISSNGFNGLAVNGNYLFYYDGFNIAAFSKATGVKVGFTTVAGYTAKRQGGIAVDECNNVYVGGNNGDILCYNFNGTNFTSTGTIPTGATTANKFIYDIKLDKPTNILYVSGSGFVGTYSAVKSLACLPICTVTPFCNGSIGGAVASVTTSIGSPTISYIWTNTSGTVSTTYTTSATSNTVSPLANGIYSVQIQINAPCGPIWNGTVQVTCPTCSVTISATTGCVPLPGGTTTSLSVNSTWGYTPMPTYSWTGPGGFSSTSPNPSFLNGGNYGIYTITATNFTCQYTTTLQTTPVPSFTPVLTSTAVLCFGGNTGLATTTVIGNGVPPYTYQWSNAQTTQTATGLATGIYSVNVIDSRQCLFSGTVQVTQPPPLTISVLSNTNNVCAGKTINANSSSAGGVGPYTYTWTNGPTNSAYNISEAIPGTYVYSVTSTDANGCVISGILPLTFNQIPVITVSSQTVCFNDKASLSANGAETYQWMPVNYSGSNYTTTGVSNSYYTVVGTNTTTGCSSMPVTSTLIVNPLPVPSIARSNNKGCVPLCMTFTASNSGNGVQSCSWDLGDGSFASNVINTDRCYTMAGNYKVKATVMDLNGCVNYVYDSLEVYPIPVADFNYAPLKPIVNVDEVTFTDASHEAKIAKWDWYFMNLPKPHSNYQNPVYQYMEPGTYAIALVVTSDHGCIDTIVKTIIVGEDYGIYVPNIFSPNGDGLNDVFQPKGFGITKYELRIFNRWGEELMFTNDFGHGWDGFYKGKLSQEDTYVWKINLTNVFGKSHELTGHVTLIK